MRAITHMSKFWAMTDACTSRVFAVETLATPNPTETSSSNPNSKRCQFCSCFSTIQCEALSSHICRIGEMQHNSLSAHGVANHWGQKREIIIMEERDIRDRHEIKIQSKK